MYPPFASKDQLAIPRPLAHYLLGHFIRLDRSFGAHKRLHGELFHIRLAGVIIDNGIVASVIGFHLFQISGPCSTSHPGPQRTLSSLSIMCLVYARTSASSLCSSLARIWLTIQYSPDHVSSAPHSARHLLHQYAMIGLAFSSWPARR